MGRAEVKAKALGFLAVLAGLITAVSTAAEAKVLESIPSHYVKVSISPPGQHAPGQLKRALVYLDGPILLWRGSWLHPDHLEDVQAPRSPVPELLVPVRVVLPGAYKFIDLESRDSILGEIRAETYTQEARIYRVLLPIHGMRQKHRFEVVFHAGLRAPLELNTSFEPPEGLVVRSKECVRQGVTLDEAVEGFERGQSTPTIVYLFCHAQPNKVQTSVYAPMDQRWTKFGYGARRVYADRGLFFNLPRPSRGTMVPETVTEFVLETTKSGPRRYELRYDPPYRPRLFSLNFSLAPALYQHYRESKRGITKDELSFWGKLALQVKTPLEGLDGYVDIAGTFHNYLHKPDEATGNIAVPHFNYFDWTARLGYVEPVTPAESEWSFMGGWYTWRFYVERDAYGLVDKLAGPQLFVQYKHQRLRQAPWWVNARWSILGDRGFPSEVDSHDVTVGGGFDLLWVGKRRPLALNLEFSRLQFQKEDRNQLLHSLILSVSYPIY